MRKYAGLAATLTAFMLILFSNSIKADLCVLKNGDYTISSTVCSTADGNGDDIVDLVFSVGESLSLDVVYEQTAGPYEAELFTYLMFYDTANMNGTTVTCNADPSDYFNDNMAPTLGLPQCTTPNGGTAGTAVDSAGIKVVEQTYMNFSGNKAPATPVSFVLDQIVFANGYTTTSADHNPGSEKYTIDFSTTGGSPTDVGLLLSNGERCAVLTGTQDCAANGIAQQTIMQSRIFIDPTLCYIGPPSGASVSSCNYSGTGTCADGESATAMLSFTLPNKCWEDTACTTACATETPTYGVSFNNAGGTTITQTATSYTDTTATIGTNVSYTLTGIDTRAAGACNSSASLTCTNTATASAACECGDPPVITLTEETKFGDTCTSCNTYVEGSDITIKYSLVDPDGTLPASIPAGNIVFYYTNDLSTSVTVKTFTVTDLDSSGRFTAKIDKAYVTAGVDLYFGVIAKDIDNQIGELPNGLACTATSTADCLTTANKINGDNIIKGTRCAYVTGYTPYPSQFPFRATGYSDGSDGNLLKIFFMMNEVSNVTMRIYTMDGMLVRQIENNTTQVALPGSGDICSGESCNYCNWQSGCQWDGTTYKGGNNLVANGMYIVNIHSICTGDNFYGQSVDYTKGIVVMK